MSGPNNPEGYPPDPGYPGGQSQQPQDPGMYGQTAEQPSYQQPYPQPYQQPYPQAYPPPVYGPPPQQRKSNKGLWIAGGVIAGVLILTCAGVGVFTYIAAQVGVGMVSSAISAVNTATDFCSDEMIQDYADAYTLFSPSLQAKMTQNQFATASQALDQKNGQVQNCVPPETGGSPTVNSNTIVFTLAVTRHAQSTGTITLIKDGKDWKIDQIDPALGLS